jgi:hypothetical protein
MSDLLASLINPLGLEVACENPAELIPQHGITEPVNVGRLAASMASAGWLGTPLVLDGGTLLTGHHRTAAAMRAGIDVPTVQGDALLAAAGVDIEDWTFKGWVDWEQAFSQLPAAVSEAYGIDL